MHNLRSPRIALASGMLAMVASCWTAGNVTTATPEQLTRGGETTASKFDLPTSCVTLLAQLQCRLRVAGNDGPAIDHALGALRASLEAASSTGDVSDPDARCKNDMRIVRPAIRAAGCESAVGRLADLPPGHPAECALHEFFFVRRDGRVAGCHRDCTTSQDCAAGTSCTSVGYAPGGPLDEPFCE